MEHLMMQAERRTHNERIEISRPVSLVGGRGEETNAGYTKNLSEGGIRARFESKAEPGANVLVRLALVPDAEPVERRAKVVWTAPDLYGEGTEVGLRLLDDDEPDEPAVCREADGPETTVPRAPHGMPRLGIGSQVEIETEGIGLEARVEAIGEIGDDGSVTVTLRILDGDGHDDLLDEEHDDLLDEERWKPRPFRDAYNRVMRVLGPVIRFMAPILATLLRLTGRGLTWLWSKLPQKFTTKVESVWSRVALRKRASAFYALTRNAASRLSTKLKPSIASKQGT